MSTLELACAKLVDGGADGALAFVRVDGRDDAAAAGAVAAADRFRTGSVTKTAVAALVLLLAEDGLLRLDDSAGRWAPDGTTVRDLLRHTSGLPDYAANPEFRERFLREPEAAWDADELLQLAGPARPGAGTFAYSNTNYVVLGRLAEAAGGAPLGRLLAERLFEPLALDETELTAAAGAAAGGVVSTAGDVARLLRGLLGGTVLSPASLEEMLTTVPGDGIECARYGLGIAELDSFMGIVPSPCGTAWGHLGFLPGCTCAALSTRDGERQVVLMAAGPFLEAFGEAMWGLFCV